MDKLTDQQRIVIDHLVSGMTQTDAAKATGIDRVTLWKWSNENSDFISSLRQRRQDIFLANTERLRRLAGSAVSVLEELLKSDNDHIRLKASTAILRSIGMMAVDAPGLQTDPGIIQKREIDRRHYQRL